MIRWAVALALLATTAHAQSTPVLGPGQENAVLGMLQVETCELQSAQIDRDRIVARYRCEAEHEVVLRHPTASTSRHRTERFAIESDAPPWLVDVLLASIREGEPEVSWSEATDGESHSAIARHPGLAWLTWACLAMVVLIGIREGSRPSRAYWVLVPIALAMLAIPDWGPLHEHLTFTARSDCARIGCTRERPGWLEPTYHAYYLLLRLVPYGSRGLSLLSAMLTIVALAMQLAWLRSVAPRVAIPAVLLCGLHPLVLQASVAHSFWPFALALSWTGAWLAERDGVRAKVGAACAWALAGTTSVAWVGVVLIFVARAAWKDRRRAWMWIPTLAFIAWHVMPFIADLGGGDLAPRLHPRHFVDHALFDPRVSPFGFGALILAGVVLARRTGWALALTLAIVSALPALGESIETGFPVAFLHGFPLVALAAPLAALAWCSAPTKLRALPIVLITFSAPTAIEAWTLERQPVAHEQREIETALASLPPHRRLVIAPELLEPMNERWVGDPIEVRFPVGFYRAHGFDAEIVHLDDFLKEPPTGDEDTLIYIGTSLVSFHPSEIDDEVRADPRRPILRRLDARVEPIATFDLSTRSHRWVLMRVGPDSSPTIELGFHRLYR